MFGYICKFLFSFFIFFLLCAYVCVWVSFRKRRKNTNTNTKSNAEEVSKAQQWDYTHSHKWTNVRNWRYSIALEHMKTGKLSSLLPSCLHSLLERWSECMSANVCVQVNLSACDCEIGFCVCVYVFPSNALHKQHFHGLPRYLGLRCARSLTA